MCGRCVDGNWVTGSCGVGFVSMEVLTALLGKMDLDDIEWVLDLNLGFILRKLSNWKLNWKIPTT